MIRQSVLRVRLGLLDRGIQIVRTVKNWLFYLKLQILHLLACLLPFLTYLVHQLTFLFVTKQEFKYQPFQLVSWGVRVGPFWALNEKVCKKLANPLPPKYFFIVIGTTTHPPLRSFVLNGSPIVDIKFFLRKGPRNPKLFFYCWIRHAFWWNVSLLAASLKLRVLVTAPDI